MTPYEGKRKTRGNLGHGNGLESHSSAEPPSNRIQELMKLHFETKFQPLPAIENVATPTESNDELTDDGDDSIGDWEGFPEIDADLVEVVQQGPEVITESSLDSKELRVFMSNKPPLSSEDTLDVQSPLPHQGDTEDAMEKANLSNDISLQRLLKESHLLDNDSILSQVGQTRHKTLDLRLQQLGSKASVFSQRNMPIAQRKGISARATDLEQKRRREARENGIILERVGKAEKRATDKRPKSIGAPTVGKFRGGTLHLSKRDVKGIQRSDRQKR